MYLCNIIAVISAATIASVAADPPTANSSHASNVNKMKASRNETLPVLGGVDVVSYFEDGKASWGDPSIVGHLLTDEGKPKNITELVSYPFFFSSTSNKEKFLANPWKYAPAYGGFCAFGIAYERKRGQSGQPWAPDWPWDWNHLGPPAGPFDAWKIDKGNRLFMNYVPSISSAFFSKEDGIPLADQRWADWWGKQNSGPFNTQCFGLANPTRETIENKPNGWNLNAEGYGVNGTSKCCWLCDKY